MQSLHTKGIQIIGLLVFILIVAATLWFFVPDEYTHLFFSKQEDTSSQQTTDPPPPFDELDGTMYLAMGIDAFEHEFPISVRFDIYEYDFSTESIEPVFLESDFIRISPQINKDRSEMVYSRILSLDKQLERDGEDFDFSNSDPTRFFSAELDDPVGTEQRIASSTEADEYWFKSSPALSPNGEWLAYKARQPTGDSLDLNAWRVTIAEVTGEEFEVIGSGVYPEWSPTGSSVITLQSDGIWQHYLDERTNSSQRILSSSSTISATGFTKMNVSTDKKYLALTNFGDDGLGTNDVLVYRIVSWDPLELELEVTIDDTNDRVHWPVFSPDNQFLALVNLSLDESSRIIVYHLGTLARRNYQLSPQPLTWDAVELSDWVE